MVKHLQAASEASSLSTREDPVVATGSPVCHLLQRSVLPPHRGLVPLGVAYIGGKQTVKPWPEDIDEWTHHLHDVDGNPVANDRAVGPPRHVQWVTEPRWQRHHEMTPSVNALVSSRGRLFAIIFSLMAFGGALFALRQRSRIELTAAFVYAGSSAGVVSSPLWTAISANANENFGHSVSSAGDVDGDGYDEVLVGAPFYFGGQSTEGRAVLYPGSSAGPATSPGRTR